MLENITKLNCAQFNWMQYNLKLLLNSLKIKKLGFSL